MDPKIAKRIISGEDGQALAKHLFATVRSLDSLADIKVGDPVEVAVEVKARQLAAEKLRLVLTTLLDAQAGDTMEDEANQFAV